MNWIYLLWNELIDICYYVMTNCWLIDSNQFNSNQLTSIHGFHFEGLHSKIDQNRLVFLFYCRSLTLPLINVKPDLFINDYQKLYRFLFFHRSLTCNLSFVTSWPLLKSLIFCIVCLFLNCFGFDWFIVSPITNLQPVVCFMTWPS